MTEGFKVIVVDPPWRYNHRANDVTHRARNQYPDMSLDEIKALPIRKLAHSDCVLWLWTTNGFMFDAIEILDAWGFRREEILTWVKDRMGLGDLLRSRTEHCLLGIKGEPAKPVNPPSTLLEAPMRRHSRKPDEFYSVVDAVCGFPFQSSGTSSSLLRTSGEHHDERATDDSFGAIRGSRGRS